MKFLFFFAVFLVASYCQTNVTGTWNVVTTGNSTCCEPNSPIQLNQTGIRVTVNLTWAPSNACGSLAGGVGENTATLNGTILPLMLETNGLHVNGDMIFNGNTASFTDQNDCTTTFSKAS